MQLPLLSAEWHRLAMLHFDADAAALQRYVPQGTEIDLWQGQAVVSVVALLSRHTRALGVLPAALAPSFAQINLRTYVRRPGQPGEHHLGADGQRHGAVFLCELGPQRLLGACARAYGEPFFTVETGHEFSPGRVRYDWCLDGEWSELTLDFSGAPTPLEAGTEAEFLGMRHWGYRRRGPRTRECRVDHPRWHHWVAQSVDLAGSFHPLVPPWLAEVLAGRPRSAYLAAGSMATMFHVGSFG